MGNPPDVAKKLPDQFRNRMAIKKFRAAKKNLVAV